MVSIDGRRVVFSATFLVPNEKEVLLEAEIDGTVLRMSITFKAASPGEERDGRWMNDDGLIRMQFIGWNDPSGNCLQAPAKFGELGDQRLYFQLAHHRVSEQNLAHLFIYLGD